MQQAIQKSRHSDHGVLAGLGQHLSLAGSLAGELIALASLVAGLAGGLAVLAYFVG